MEHKRVLHETKKGSTWNQKGFSYGNSGRTMYMSVQSGILEVQVRENRLWVKTSQERHNNITSNCICPPGDWAGLSIQSDPSGLPSVQVRPSHSDQSSPNTWPIVGLDLCDVGNLPEGAKCPQFNLKAIHQVLLIM